MVRDEEGNGVGALDLDLFRGVSCAIHECLNDTMHIFNQASLIVEEEVVLERPECSQLVLRLA